jgi:hypothetical protein
LSINADAAFPHGQEIVFAQTRGGRRDGREGEEEEEGGTGYVRGPTASARTLECVRTDVAGVRVDRTSIRTDA